MGAGSVVRTDTYIQFNKIKKEVMETLSPDPAAVVTFAPSFCTATVITNLEEKGGGRTENNREGPREKEGAGEPPPPQAPSIVVPPPRCPAPRCSSTPCAP